MLEERELQNGLQTRILGRRIHSFQRIDSTNRYAQALAESSGEEGTVVVAEEQTAGRGRLGRSWESKPGENLTFSLILREGLESATVHRLPLATAVAIAHAVEDSTGLPVECKWPNDLLIHGRKFAGILLESSIKLTVPAYVLIGIGINVNQTTFPAEFDRRATSLKRESGQAVNRPTLFRSCLASLELTYDRVRTGAFEEILEEWISRTTMIEKTVSVSINGTVLSGIVRGLTGEGGLILHTGGGDRVLFAGDVTTPIGTD